MFYKLLYILWMVIGLGWLCFPGFFRNRTARKAGWKIRLAWWGLLIVIIFQFWGLISKLGEYGSTAGITVIILLLFFAFKFERSFFRVFFEIFARIPLQIFRFLGVCFFVYGLYRYWQL